MRDNNEIQDSKNQRQRNAMRVSVTIEVFANNTNLTLTLRDFKRSEQKIKLPPVGIELTTEHHWFIVSDDYPTVLSRHMLNRRFLKLNFVSCTTSLFGIGIISRFNRT